MLKNLQAVTKNVKFKRKIAYTDNLVFRLHYRYTFIGLLAGVILVSSRQYFGEHIRCIADQGVQDRVIETFCYFTNTFTVVRHYHQGPDGMVPHPGVGPMVEGEPILGHAYYQWVPYVFCVQAVLCFVPHFIWQQLEGGRVKAMTKCFQNASLASGVSPTKINEKLSIPSAVERELKIDQVCRAFMARLHINTLWAFSLVGCEILNVANIVLQVYLMQWFLGGNFATLGRLLMGDDPRDEENPLDMVFPKVTKCTFHKYGPSGSIQQHDALCVMSLNVVNEKLYLILWFWYIFLFALSAGVVLYRLISMVLYSRSRTFNRCVFLVSCPVSLDKSSVASVTKACNYGDWLFLHHLAKSLEGFVFMDLFNRLAMIIDENKPKRIVNDIAENDIEPLFSLPRSKSNATAVDMVIDNRGTVNDIAENDNESLFSAPRSNASS